MVGGTLLTRFNFDPLTVSKITGLPEQAYWEYLESYNQTLNEYARTRDEAKVRADARDWAEQLPDAYDAKRLVIRERLQDAKTDEEKKNHLIHYKLFTGKMQSVSPQMIERARAFPLKDLLGTHRPITNCPFHDDKTASLNIKNNFYYCHGCGASGDTIDFIIKRDGLTFAQAVTQLQ